MEYGLIRTIAIYALPVIFAITLHEAAHGYAASFFGDKTARAQGRNSLNPVRHVDPIGTILVPFLILLLGWNSGGLMYGWARPIPVNMAALKNPKRDMVLVAAAGPAANLVMALLWAILLKTALELPANDYTLPMTQMGDAGVEVNVVLMLLNLLPIPPLDGARIAASFLPRRAAWSFSRIEPFGFAILLLLIASHSIEVIIAPAFDASEHIIHSLFQI